jgi:flavin reductase (DIM6/NTAB) family NADH-FMN oxidoreductase RutF
MAMSPDTFKAAMGQLASGVTVVTMRAGAEDHGFTATSFTSLSLDPMLVLVCVMKGHRGHEQIEEAGHFAVNVLCTSQKELGLRFANAADLDRFRGLALTRAVTGAAILPGNLAWVDCTVKHVYPGGDHTIFVGEVLAGEAPGGQEALLYYDRRWGHFRGE